MTMSEIYDLKWEPLVSYYNQSMRVLEQKNAVTSSIAEAKRAVKIKSLKRPFFSPAIQFLSALFIGTTIYVLFPLAFELAAKYSAQKNEKKFDTPYIINACLVLFMISFAVLLFMLLMNSSLPEWMIRKLRYSQASSLSVVLPLECLLLFFVFCLAKEYIENLYILFEGNSALVAARCKVLTALSCSIAGFIFLYCNAELRIWLWQKRNSLESEIEALNKRIIGQTEHLNHLIKSPEYQNMIIGFGAEPSQAYISKLLSIISSMRAKTHHEAIVVYETDRHSAWEQLMKKRSVAALEKQAISQSATAAEMKRMNAELKSLTKKMEDVKRDCRSGNTTSALDNAEKCTSILNNIASIMSILHFL